MHQVCTPVSDLCIRKCEDRQHLSNEQARCVRFALSLQRDQENPEFPK